MVVGSDKQAVGVICVKPSLTQNGLLPSLLSMNRGGMDLVEEKMYFMELHKILIPTTLIDCFWFQLSLRLFLTVLVIQV